jgi:flagellar motor switch protein FliN/FliY
MEELSSLEKETIGEVGNISLGASATALSVILNREVDITTPRLEQLHLSDVQRNYPIPCLAVEVSYTTGLQGSNMLLIKEKDAVIIAAMMMGETFEGKEGPLNEIELSAVQEAMNQMMGSMATSMSELFTRAIDITPPKIERIDMAEEKIMFGEYSDEDLFVQVEFNIKVEDIINSVMVQVIPVAFARQMAGYLLGEVSDSASASAPEADAGAEAGSEQKSDVAAEFNNNAVEEAIIAPTGQEGEELSDLEKDTLGEVGNISLGSSATALSLLLNRSVEITTPKVEIIKVKDIQKKYPIPCLLVEVDYIEGLRGSNVLLVKEDDALIIAALMMGEEKPKDKEDPLTELEMSAVQEAMNQMMGSMATSMSELFMRTIDISPPRMELIDLSDEREMLADMDSEDSIVHVEFSIKVEDMIDSVMVQVIPMEFAREMAGYLLKDHYGEDDLTSQTVKTPAQKSAPPEPEIVEKEEIKREIPSEKAADRKPAKPQPSTSAPLFKGISDLDLEKLDLVRDVPMDITVVLGTTRMPLGGLFALDKGGTVELDCNVNDPVEIIANDRLLARGEIVMINDQLGVRITEIQFEEVLDQYNV